MSKKWNIKLSESSVNNLISELKSYKNDLQEKEHRFIGLLAEKGIKVAIESSTGDSHHFDSMVKFEKKYIDNTSLYIIGRNSDLSRLHTEWYDGNGVYHTETISPILALEYGTAGFAIKGHAGTAAVTGNHVADTKWYYYTDVDNNGNPIKLHKATAEEAHSPMNNAFMKVMEEIQSTAKEVFGNE